MSIVIQSTALTPRAVGLRLLAFLALSGLTTFAIDFYSFALAHSAAGIFAVLVCPGILIIVANLFVGVLGWAAAVAVNVLYYELAWRFIRRSRRG
ncbi:MAG: hypothetical protein RLY71_533 [Pseudomonadota bacterium]|jgi:hypothetical protein